MDNVTITKKQYKQIEEALALLKQYLLHDESPSADMVRTVINNLQETLDINDLENIPRNTEAEIDDIPF